MRCLACHEAIAPGDRVLIETEDASPNARLTGPGFTGGVWHARLACAVHIPVHVIQDQDHEDQGPDAGAVNRLRATWPDQDQDADSNACPRDADTTKDACPWYGPHGHSFPGPSYRRADCHCGARFPMRRA